MLYLIDVKSYFENDLISVCSTLGALTLGLSSCLGFGNMGRSCHTSSDQSAALSHAVTPLPV